MQLAGKTALVTGASRGIGREIAMELARLGAKIAVHYGRGREGAEETARMIAEAGGQAFVLGGDISKLEDIEAMLVELDKGLAAWGRPELDILVNNAGIGGGGSIHTTTHEDLDALIATNIRGVFLLTQRAIGRIPDGGRVINITSMVGLAAYPGSIAYALTKAAQNSVTASLAVELGPRNITVNGVAPGATDTDFIAMLTAVPKLAKMYADKATLKRLGKPDDIAPVVAFLASDSARWITGQIIEASGGMHLE
jgi:NAD(P)-dependent dehydrogenase (short-subunit alcohol dehydrogenase family)